MDPSPTWLTAHETASGDQNFGYLDILGGDSNEDGAVSGIYYTEIAPIELSIPSHRYYAKISARQKDIAFRI